jgi:hypothetical protein
MYAAIVAPPGSAKSPALQAVMRPMFDEQASLYAESRDAKARYREDVEHYKQSQRRGAPTDAPILELVAGPPSPPPPMRHIFTADTTVEALRARVKTS